MTQNKRILLVDDDDELRGSLAEQLELYDEFATEQTSSGARALEIAKSEHFDLVLLDIGLPDLDGHEVCRMMRKSGLSVPIIMLTGAEPIPIRSSASTRAPTTTSPNPSSSTC